MIFSKKNLQIASICKSNLPGHAGVTFGKDGATFATNGHVIICVSPVLKAVRKKLMDIKRLSKDVKILANSVLETVKNVKPKTKEQALKFLLENVSLHRLKGERFRFRIFDGSETKDIVGKLDTSKGVNYRKVLRDSWRDRIDFRCGVNLQNFIDALVCIRQINADCGKIIPLYIEVTKKGYLIIRTVNARTSQRIIIMVQGMRVTDKKMKLSKWERKIFNGDEEE